MNTLYVWNNEKSYKILKIIDLNILEYNKYGIKIKIVKKKCKKPTLIIGNKTIEGNKQIIQIITDKINMIKEQLIKQQQVKKREVEQFNDNFNDNEFDSRFKDDDNDSDEDDNEKIKNEINQKLQNYTKTNKYVYPNEYKDNNNGFSTNKREINDNTNQITINNTSDNIDDTDIDNIGDTSNHYDANEKSVINEYLNHDEVIRDNGFYSEEEQKIYDALIKDN